MGRNLAIGVATTIHVAKKNHTFYGKYDIDFTKEKEKILKDIGKIIDITTYNSFDYEDGFVLEIKPSHFDNNIHELVKELYPLMDCSQCTLYSLEDEVDITSKDFNKEKWPLNLIRKKRRPDEEDEDILYIKQLGYEERYFLGAPKYFLFESRIYQEVLTVDLYMIELWYDVNKYLGEDETPMLNIMNHMSRAYFKSPLSKNILFYILG